MHRDERPRIARGLLAAQDRGAFGHRHADVVEMAKRQRGEPAAVRGRPGALG